MGQSWTSERVAKLSVIGDPTKAQGARRRSRKLSVGCTPAPTAPCGGDWRQTACLVEPPDFLDCTREGYREPATIAPLALAVPGWPRLGPFNESGHFDKTRRSSSTVPARLQLKSTYSHDPSPSIGSRR